MPMLTGDSEKDSAVQVPLTAGESVNESLEVILTEARKEVAAATSDLDKGGDELASTDMLVDLGDPSVVGPAPQAATAEPAAVSAPAPVVEPVPEVAAVEPTAAVKPAAVEPAAVVTAPVPVAVEPSLTSAPVVLSATDNAMLASDRTIPVSLPPHMLLEREAPAEEDDRTIISAPLDAGADHGPVVPTAAAALDDDVTRARVLPTPLPSSSLPTPLPSPLGSSAWRPGPTPTPSWVPVPVTKRVLASGPTRWQVAATVARRIAARRVDLSVLQISAIIVAAVVGGAWMFGGASPAPVAEPAPVVSAAQPATTPAPAPAVAAPQILPLPSAPAANDTNALPPTGGARMARSQHLGSAGVGGSAGVRSAGARSQGARTARASGRAGLRVASVRKEVSVRTTESHPVTATTPVRPAARKGVAQGWVDPFSQ